MLALDLLRVFFVWKPAAPIISHLIMCVVPLVIVPVMDAWKHASRLVRGVVVGPAKTQSALVVGGFLQLVVLVAVLVAYVMPPEQAAAQLPREASMDEIRPKVASLSWSLICGHLALNALSVFGIVLLFLRWAWSASDEELAKLRDTMQPLAGGNAEDPEGEGEGEGQSNRKGDGKGQGTGPSSSSSSEGAEGREASPYAETAQWNVKKAATKGPSTGKGEGEGRGDASQEGGESDGKPRKRRGSKPRKAKET